MSFMVRSTVFALVSVCAAAGYDGPRLVIDAPAEMGAAEQASVSVRLSAPADREVQGRIFLETASENRAALFSTGGREAEFRIAANETEATFSGRKLLVQSGSGSGELALRASLDEDDDAARSVIRVPAVAPVLNTGAIRVRALNGQPINLDTREFEVIIPGVAPSRDVQRAEFRFRPSRPGGLERTEIIVDVSAQFRDFFAANAGRTDFVLVMPFTVTGSLLDIAGAAITLVNAAGERSNEGSGDSDILP